jgi:DNA-directed RNA polymerase specialized sigma24 family protein
MQSLYPLAFLPTANHADAEECFSAGMEDPRNGHTVVKEWALSWSRRILIKTAIRMIAPRSAQSLNRMHDQTIGPRQNDESEACTTINAVSQLASLDRIVIVMSVLERYSVRECAALLDCSVRDVQPARMRALLQLPVRAFIVS